jgi:hypothetical protein
LACWSFGDFVGRKKNETKMALTSKVEEFRTRADSCFRQAESCSTQLDKDHWLKLAEDWLKMAQNEIPTRSRRSDESIRA